MVARAKLLAAVIFLRQFIWRLLGFPILNYDDLSGVHWINLECPKELKSKYTIKCPEDDFPSTEIYLCYDGMSSTAGERIAEQQIVEDIYHAVGK